MYKISIFILVVALGLADAALKLDNESELREAQAALFNVDSISGWILVNYVGPSTVHFAAGGEGGVGEIVPHLEDAQIQYGVIRLQVNDEGASQATPRDVFFTWIGPQVGIIEKGKKAALLGDAQSFLQPFHTEVTVLNKEAFTDETVKDRSDALSDSHIID